MSDPLRFFVPPESLQGDQVTLSGETHHHLHKVLRVRPGTHLTLLDGLGGCCEVELEMINRQESRARVIRRWRETDRSLPITLIQAVPKGDKLDLVLQKGTELGVRKFRLVETVHSVPQISPDRLRKREQRWIRIIAEAARQCRRSFLPEIKLAPQLAEVINEQTDDLKLVLWEAGAIPLAETLPDEAPAGIRLLVGPEGGFAEDEIAAITAAGFVAVHLGPRILRTETAGLAAVSVLQYLYGDWRQTPAESS